MVKSIYNLLTSLLAPTLGIAGLFNKKIKLSSSLIKSKSNNFPYENISGQGKIILTIVDGKIIFNDRSFNIK